MIKKIFINIYYFLWLIKCKYHYWLWGPYGVSHCIEVCPHPFIVKILRKYGALIGNNCNIERGLILHRPDKDLPFKNLTIGENVYIGHNMLIDLTKEVKIGDYTAFGANCQIWTHTGNWTFDRSDEKEKRHSVIIGKSVIIYSGVIISEGTTIGDFARAGAGSVVLKNIKELEFHAGIPAELVTKRNF